MQDSLWDERELVRRCKEGQEAAYAELVRLHAPRLMNLAFRLTGDRATSEDVVQETFLAAYRAMERFEPRPSLAPWLNTIAVRLASRTAGRRAAQPATSLDRMVDGDDEHGRLPSILPALGFASVAPDPHAAAEAAELRGEVASALADLPFRQRAAVVLRFVLGLDYADAARSMDVPLNTYKSLLLRGTRQLREVLGPRLAPPATGSDGNGSGPGLRVPTAVVAGERAVVQVATESE